MAKKKSAPMPSLPVKNYRILVPSVGKMLGPHKVFEAGGSRYVILNEKQAKYWITTGVIVEDI